MKNGNNLSGKEQIEIWKYGAVFVGNTATKFSKMELRTEKSSVEYQMIVKTFGRYNEMEQL